MNAKVRELQHACESACVTMEYIIEELDCMCDDCADLYADDIRMLETEVERIKKTVLNSLVRKVEVKEGNKLNQTDEHPLDLHGPKDAADFVAIDKLDEQAIVAEMKGNVMKEWFYEFKSGGKQIIGVSKEGIYAWSHQRAQAGMPITIESIEEISQADIMKEIRESHKDGIYTADEAKERIDNVANLCVMRAKAVDTVTGEARWGGVEQPKIDYGKPDKFWYRKALAKCQRNAIAAFMDTATYKELYNMWSKSKASKIDSNPVGITDAQQDQIFSLQEKLGIDDDALQVGIKKALSGTNVAVPDLTFSQAQIVISQMLEGLKRRSE